MILRRTWCERSTCSFFPNCRVQRDAASASAVKPAWKLCTRSPARSGFAARTALGVSPRSAITRPLPTESLYAGCWWLGRSATRVVQCRQQQAAPPRTRPSQRAWRRRLEPVAAAPEAQSSCIMGSEHRQAFRAVRDAAARCTRSRRRASEPAGEFPACARTVDLFEACSRPWHAVAAHRRAAVAAIAQAAAHSPAVVLVEAAQEARRQGGSIPAFPDLPPYSCCCCCGLLKKLTFASRSTPPPATPAGRGPY